MSTALEVQGGKLLDMRHLFTVSILNILWRMITGDRFEYEDPKLLELIKFMEVLSNNYSLAGDIYLAFPKLRHVLPYLTGHGKERRIYEPKMLQEFKNLLNKRRQTNYGGDYLIDSFVKKSAEELKTGAKANANAEAYTDENFAVIILDLFFGGSETTSNTLEFAFQYMIQHPDVQARLQAEIDAVIGRHLAPQCPDLGRMPYMEATLLEIMRFSTVVPFVARVPREDVQLRGFSVPKKSMVINNLHAVHFDVNYWGDPHVFRPERYLADRGICPVKKSRTIPFGLGRRQCLGETLARANLFIYFTTLLQHYTFEAWKEAPPKEGKRVGLTVAPLQYFAVLKHREWTEVQ